MSLPEEVEKKPWAICTQDELKLLAKWLGVRDDWHEPDESGVTAEVHGVHLDNAGFWGSHELEMRANDTTGTYRGRTGEDCMEFWVTILKDGKPVAEIDLATLFAFACGTYDGREMIPRGYGARTRWSAVLAQAIHNAAKNAFTAEGH